MLKVATLSSYRTQSGTLKVPARSSNERSPRLSTGKDFSSTCKYANASGAQFSTLNQPTASSILQSSTLKDVQTRKLTVKHALRLPST
jgi:hypothetical protein